MRIEDGDVVITTETLAKMKYEDLVQTKIRSKYSLQDEVDIVSKGMDISNHKYTELKEFIKQCKAEARMAVYGKED